MGIRRTDSSLDVTTEAIAAHFRKYYTKLYNLPPQHRPPDLLGDRKHIIQDFLLRSGLPKLKDIDIIPLEEQITSTEIRQADKLSKA